MEKVRVKDEGKSAAQVTIDLGKLLILVIGVAILFATTITYWKYGNENVLKGLVPGAMLTVIGILSYLPGFLKRDISHEYK